MDGVKSHVAFAIYEHKVFNIKVAFVAIDKAKKFAFGYRTVLELPGKAVSHHPAIEPFFYLCPVIAFSIDASPADRLVVCRNVAVFE